MQSEKKNGFPSYDELKVHLERILITAYIAAHRRGQENLEQTIRYLDAQNNIERRLNELCIKLSPMLSSIDASKLASNNLSTLTKIVIQLNQAINNRFKIPNKELATLYIAIADKQIVTDLNDINAQLIPQLKDVMQCLDINNGFDDSLHGLESYLEKNPPLAIDKKVKKLFTQARDTIKQIKNIKNSDSKPLNYRELTYLIDVLSCTKTILEKRNQPNELRAAVNDLTALASRAPGKASPGWMKLGKSLLILACAALVAIGILAAIPSGGSSLLLSAIGTAGLASTTIVGTGIASVGLFGAGASYYGRHKGLAKSMLGLTKATETFTETPSTEQENRSPATFGTLSSQP